MKSLGIKLLDEICYLAQRQIITRDERIEYANLISLAMGNYPNSYGILKDKLRAKLATCPDAHYDDLDNVITLINREH